MQSALIDPSSITYVLTVNQLETGISLFCCYFDQCFKLLLLCDLVLLLLLPRVDYVLI